MITAPRHAAGALNVIERLRRRPDLVVPTVLVVMGFMLFAGFAFKAPCIGPQHGEQFSQGCYNDVQFLWGQRALGDHVFPYIHGDIVDGNITGHTPEYPVLTGVFIWLASLPADNADSYLVWTTLLLMPFGLLASGLLARMVGWRALLFAAAPAIVLYAFHNWDLLVVAATVGAFYAWWRERYGWAAVWLGVGACLKFYPLFFLAPLVLDRWLNGDRRAALRSLGLGVGTIVVFNLPFALANADGWWSPYEFQRLRNADWTSNSIWVWGAHSLTEDPPGHFDPTQLNRLTPILIGLSFAIALGVGWWRHRQEGEFPFVQVCGAMIMAFVLWGKVFSPQYALWLLPFFALIRVRWGWWVAFSVIDVVLYFSLFRWFFDVSFQGKPFTSLGLANEWLIVSIWGRAVVVGLLFIVFLCSRPAFSRPAAAGPQHLEAAAVA